MKENVENRPEESELLSANQIATMLGKSSNSVYYLIKAHSIPHYRIGNRMYVAKTDFQAWLDAQKVG